MSEEKRHRGDTGMTTTAAKKQVSKADLQIEACGSLDELNAFLGWAGLVQPTAVAAQIHWLQDRISDAAAAVSGYRTDRWQTCFFEAAECLETWTADIQQQLPPLQGFIRMGKRETSARLHLARATARRVERSVVRAFTTPPPEIPGLFAFLNRVSDFLFHLARLADAL